MDTKILTCVAILIGAPSLTAQLPSAADSAQILLSTAESFESDGQSEVAEALYRFIAEHFDTTPAAVQARQRFSELRRLDSERSGSVGLRIWSSIYGAWLGVAIPAWLGVDEPAPYGVGLLLGGPAGYIAGGALANSLSLTEGHARAVTLGGTWGTWQGFGWAQVLNLGGQDICFQNQCFADDAPSDEAVFGTMILGGLTGIAAGALLSRRPISPSVASAATYGALWGTWFGVASSILMGFDDGDDALASALIGGDAGLLSMALLAPGWDLTRNRARLVSIAGVIGGLGGLGIDLLIQPDGEKTLVAIPLATSIVGLMIGARMTRDSNPGLARAGDSPSPLSGALVKLDQGRFGLGFPIPTPTFIRVDAPSGQTVLKPAASFTLFAARF